MAHLKRRGFLYLRAFSHDNQDTSLQRGMSYIAFHIIPLLLLLTFLYGTLFLALPARLGFSVSHWKTIEGFWGHRSAFWSSPAIISVKSQTMTSGIIETTEELPVAAGFQQINLLNVNLTNPNVRLGVVQEHNRLLGPGETLSSMAERSGAVAGVNGDLFEMEGTGDSLGMLAINGQLWQSPGSLAVLGVTSSGRITIGPESFSGNVAVGNTSYPLHSVNRYGDTGTNHLALFTPVLGVSRPLHGATIAMLQPVVGSNSTFTVVSVQAGAALLPVLLDRDALVGEGDAGDWLNTSLHPGAIVTVSERIAPDSNLVQAIGGGPMLIKDGAPYQNPSTLVSGRANAHNPLTAVGVTKDGTHALLVVCDGHQADPGLSPGFTHAEMVNYLLAHGAYQAMLFDSGGSSEMVARLPGQSRVSVINSPSDGRERAIASGLFLYSTEKQPGPATSVVINNGNPLTLFAGTTVPISTYALDALDNPAANPAHVSVFPAKLASSANGTLTASLKAGQGQIVAQAGRARTVEALQVVDHLASLSLTPSTPDLANRQHLQFQITGMTPAGAPVSIATNTVRWGVDPPSLGSINPAGLFTASSSALEVGNVTATIGGTSVSASVAVGQIAQPFGSLANLRLWGVSDRYLNVFPRNVPSPGSQTVSTGSVLLNTEIKRLPTDTGSMDLRYHFLQGQHISHLNPYPNDPDAFHIPLRNSKQPPDALGIWARDIPVHTLVSEHQRLLLNIGLYESDNTPIVFHFGVILVGPWTFFVIQLPRKLASSFRLNYISLVSINPTGNEDGDVYLADLQALYAPRPTG